MENVKNMTTDREPGWDLSEARTSLLERVVEALIFTANEPVTAAQMAKVFSDLSGEDPPGPDLIQSTIDQINGTYETTERSFRVCAWAGGFRLATIQEMSPYVKALQDQDNVRKLTRSLLETVAILAYRQPATKVHVEFVRGVNCDYALRRLLEYGLADVVGRSDSIGRPLLYGTTDRFLDLFGLKSVSDLPNLREVEDILDDPAFQKDRAKMLISSGLDVLTQSISEDVVSDPPQQNGTDGEA